MGIYRVVKDKENPYVMVNKSFVNDKSLSWKAKGILLYLLSKPDDWKIYESDIIKNSSDGRDSVRSGIKELIEAGYIERTLRQDVKGRLMGYEYCVYEVSTVDGKTDNGLSDNGKPDTTNNELTNNELTEYKKENGILPGSKNSSIYINKDVVKAIKVYMNDLYRQKTKRKHPLLKPEQYKNVYNQILSICEEWSLEYDNLVDMMVQFLNSNIQSDWNINHFATEGILVNRMYEVAY